MTDRQKLTSAQMSELERLITLRLPASWAVKGFPGFPTHSLDMRSVAALERRGLAECIIHRYRVMDETSERAVVTYRATDAGRKILAGRAVP